VDLTAGAKNEVEAPVVPALRGQAPLAVAGDRARQVDRHLEAPAAVGRAREEDLAAVGPAGEDDLLPEDIDAVRVSLEDRHPW
jgi:hypothetical protein